MSKLIQCILFSLLCAITGNSQQTDTSRVSLSLNDVPVEVFVNALEQQTGFRFFFDTTQVGFFRVSINVANQSLTAILHDVFSSSNIYFAIDHDENVFLTRNYQLAFDSRPVIRTSRSTTLYSDSSLQTRSPFAAAQTLGAVTVSAALNVKSTQLGVQKVDIRTIRQVPVVFGEADVLRVVMALPGVKTVGEASTGLNVRGGSTDQNLILFNDATIYNPAHFFGMFSAFNPDVIKDVTLYKSTIPPRYGGRLSSVLDISTREGNKNKITGSAGIGLLTSRLMVEGPIKKNKSSFIVGGRTTYANWLLDLLPAEYDNSRASFYDVNASITQTFNSRNELVLNGYISHDRFNLNNDTTYGYDNRNFSVKWRHDFSNKLNALVSAGYDFYRYQVESTKKVDDAFRLDFDISQKFFRTHFNYYLNNSHTLDFGLGTIAYILNPGTFTPVGSTSTKVKEVVEPDQALESAIYLNDKFDISARVTLEAGIRYSVYNYLGPKKVYTYAEGVPKSEESIVDSTQHPTNKFIKTYGGPEYRASVRISIDENTSIKAGFNTQRQYIHMLSNTAAMAPTDTWKLSDPNIRPQSGAQVSLGIYRNLLGNTVETSVEVYYKKIKDYLDYKSGAILIMNQHIETDVINTKGKAYGAELMVKKISGKLSGWISYTWSRILLIQNDPLAGEVISNGEYYPANYDKPHDVSFTGNYKINHRFSLSLNGNYSTGRPITIPVGRYYYSGSYRTLYAERNGHRIPNYFRMDFGMNIEGNHKVKQRTHNSWTLGVYNLTGRKNPYSVYYISENGVINGYKLSIFGSAIPFVTFNIRF